MGIKQWKRKNVKRKRKTGKKEIEGERSKKRRKKKEKRRGGENIRREGTE